VSRKALLIASIVALATRGAIASPSAPIGSREEAAISAVIADYARAIETKNLELFRSVKPILSPDEEQRLRIAFANAERHAVKITLRSIEVREPRATVHLARRDTIGSIVASFPQTIVMARGPKGWTIDEISK
jgi:hypothetical protein